MGLLDKAKEAAEQARQSIEQTVDRAGGQQQQQAPPVPGEAVEDQVAVGTGGATTETQPQPPVPPAKTTSGMDDFKAQISKAARRSKESLATLVEKIDPGVLADLVIKATAAQEKANIALSQKRSPYRIAEINITATIPPQIGFSVQRMGDMEELDDPSSLELLDEVDEDPVESLAGDNPIEEEIRDAD